MKRHNRLKKHTLGLAAALLMTAGMVADCAGRRLGVCQYIFPALPDIGADQGQ